VGHSALSALITMRESPLRKDGTLTVAAEKLCSALGAAPSELWPRDMAKIKAKRARYEIEISQAEAMAIASSGEDALIQRQLLGRWMQKLGPREIMALSLRQDGLTLDEIGQELGGRSRERVRQILARAERKMRDAANRDGVTEFRQIAGGAA
jgi:RNA polymerase sigma factor (sigma-70 family)